MYRALDWLIASTLCCARSCRIGPISPALSPSRLTVTSSAVATILSAMLPGVRMKATGLPQASASAPVSRLMLAKVGDVQ